MPGQAKVIVVDADPAANAALRFGLSRAGLVVDTVATPADVGRAAGNVGLILVADAKDGIATVAAIRDELDDAALLTPILFIGGAERRAVEEAGASEVLSGPPALRDIANVARVMLGDRRPEGWGGTLAEVTGVFGLVRALSAIGRSGVLTLTRGVRRGEVRYYHGEITSAQVGMIHGQAAFHQLLLWTDAKFDFRQELVVRRRQIPLSPQELIADAEQFLESTRDIAGGLSPSVVLDVVSDKVAALAIKIPTEVHGILNMFDGRRTLVDILEDSPYRVHETLRVARKGFEAKVLRAVPSTRPKPTWKAVLSLEEWLLGAQPMVPRPARLPGEAASASGGSGASGAIAEAMHDSKTVKYGENGMQARRDPGPLEWADLVPRTSGLEMPMLSPIVPATKASGEVERELGDEPGPQPASMRSVIVSEDAIISPEERAEEERLIAERQRAEREAIAKEIEAAKAAKAEAAAKEAAAKEAAEKAEAAAKEAAAKEAAAKAEAAEKEAAAKEAAAKAAAETAAKEAAAKEAAAKEAAAKAAAEAAAKEAAAKEAATKAAAEAAAKEAAAKEAAAKAAAEAAAKEAAAKEAAAKEAAAKEASAREAAKEAAEREAAAVREAAAKETAARQAERARLLAEEEERLENEKTTKVDRRAPTASDASGKAGKKRKKDRHKVAPVAGVPVIASPAALAVTVKAEAAKSEAIPGNAAAAGDVKESVKSEVATDAKASPAKHPRAASAPIEGEPAVLVADLKAAHDAASAVAKTQAKAPATPDVGSAHGKVVEQVKNDASKATAAFTADEEAFFQKDHAAADSFDDLDVGYRRPTFWQRLLGRSKPTS